jgi:large subunit ribosomal protein L6
MSRIGRKPVDVVDGVKVGVANRVITVEGPKGRLEFKHRPEIGVAFDEEAKQIVVSRQSDERVSRELHGLTRAIVNNMVQGVKEGYEKRLEVVGVGYICAVQGKELQLRVGYANELKKQIPDGLEVTCPDQTHIVVRGCDKQKVSQFAAEVRALRKPEPYKGKGIRYQGEQIKLKPGKSAT